MNERYDSERRRRVYLEAWDFERIESARSMFFWYCVRACALVGIAVSAAFGSLEWCVVCLLAIAITVERSIDAVARRVVAMENYLEQRDD